MAIADLIEGTRPEPQPESLDVRDDNDGGKTYHLVSRQRIETVEQAIAAVKLDTSVFEVFHFTVKHYEMGSKGPDKKPCVTPMSSISFKARRKKGWNAQEFRELLIQDFKAIAPKYTGRRVAQKNAPPLLAELSIFDAHFGKLAWGKETGGSNYDVKIAERRYNTAAEDLLGRADRRGVQKIIYVVGQDFFHTDHGNTTTGGTAVEVDGRWQKAFRVGCGCMINTIQLARTIAPVDVIVVPGNHDREKSFMAGDLLAARFLNCEDVKVINNVDLYFSYYRYGVNLLGFAHGDKVTSDKRRAQLGATMATDCPKDWSETTTREWHLGHFHSEHEDKWIYRSVESIRDVVVRILPSISSTDGWHRSENYKSVLAAELHYYHKTLGRYGYEVHTVQE